MVPGEQQLAPGEPILSSWLTLFNIFVYAAKGNLVNIPEPRGGQWRHDGDWRRLARSREEFSFLFNCGLGMEAAWPAKYLFPGRAILYCLERRARPLKIQSRPAPRSYK